MMRVLDFAGRQRLVYSRIEERSADLMPVNRFAPPMSLLLESTVRCHHLGTRPHTKPAAASDAIHVWQLHDPTASTDNSRPIAVPRRSGQPLRNAEAPAEFAVGKDCVFLSRCLTRIRRSHRLLLLT